MCIVRVHVPLRLRRQGLLLLAQPEHRGHVGADTIPSSVGMPNPICCSIRSASLAIALHANFAPIGLSSGCSLCRCSAARVVSQVWAPSEGLLLSCAASGSCCRTCGGLQRLLFASAHQADVGPITSGVVQRAPADASLLSKQRNGLIVLLGCCGRTGLRQFLHEGLESEWELVDLEAVLHPLLLQSLQGGWVQALVG